MSSRRYRRAAAAPAARSSTRCSCCRSRAGRAGGRDDRRGITALAQRAAWRACRNACDAHASDVGEARAAGVRSALLSQFERAGRRTGESSRAVQFFQCIILRWCAGMPAKFGGSRCSVGPSREASREASRFRCRKRDRKRDRGSSQKPPSPHSATTVGARGHELHSRWTSRCSSSAPPPRSRHPPPPPRGRSRRRGRRPTARRLPR